MKITVCTAMKMKVSHPFRPALFYSASTVTTSGKQGWRLIIDSVGIFVNMEV